MKSKYLVIVIVFGLVLGSYPVQAQTQDTSLFLPQVGKAEDVAVAEEQLGPPEFDECKLVGGWEGQLFCSFLYLVVLRTGAAIRPEPTPIPEPAPTPEPTPVGTFTLYASGTEVETPMDDCRIPWPDPWVSCAINIKFEEINTLTCPNALSVGLNFTDSMSQDTPIVPEDYWLEGSPLTLWLKVFPVVYAEPSGYDPTNYQVEVTCLEHLDE